MGVARVLITRMPPLNPHHYDVVLEFILKHHRRLAPLFNIQLNGVRLGERTDFRVHVPWLQDPLADFNPLAFHQASLLEQDCRRLNVKVLNPASKHGNVKKVESSRRLTEARIRCARTVSVDSIERFRDDVYGLSLPILLRDDGRHMSEIVRLDTMDDVRIAPIETYTRPAISEYIDVQSPDGLYRKYRSIVIGDTTIAQHLQISESPVTRGAARLKTVETREEEIEFISKPDPHADLMQSVRRALDVDFGGIDYGFDRNGQPVIWEMNLFAHLPWSKYALTYRNFAVERCYAAMVRHYLRLADEPIPEKLERQASY